MLQIIRLVILLVLVLIAPAHAQWTAAYPPRATVSGGGGGSSTVPGGTVTGANQYRSAGGTFAGDDNIIDDGIGGLTMISATIGVNRMPSAVMSAKVASGLAVWSRGLATAYGTSDTTLYNSMQSTQSASLFVDNGVTSARFSTANIPIFTFAKLPQVLNGSGINMGLLQACTTNDATALTVLCGRVINLRTDSAVTSQTYIYNQEFGVGIDNGTFINPMVLTRRGLGINTASASIDSSLTVTGTSRLNGGVAIGATTAASQSTALLDVFGDISGSGIVMAKNVRILTGADGGTVGNGSMFVGYNTGNLTQTGVRNAGMGALTLSSLTSGQANTGIGWNTLSTLTTGSQNTAVGGATLTNMNVGGNNTAVGFGACGSLTGNAVGNVCLGYNTILPVLSNGSNQLNIANAIWGNISSGTGNANRIGINVSKPSTTLDISGTMLLSPLGAAPYTCSAAYKGAVAMTSSTSYLCSCNGSSWQNQAGGACTW